MTGHSGKKERSPVENLTPPALLNTTEPKRTTASMIFNDRNRGPELSGQGRSRPLERRRRPAPLQRIAALHTSLAAMRYSVAAWCSQLNFRERTTGRSPLRINSRAERRVGPSELILWQHCSLYRERANEPHWCFFDCRRGDCRRSGLQRSRLGLAASPHERALLLPIEKQ